MVKTILLNLDHQIHYDNFEVHVSCREYNIETQRNKDNSKSFNIRTSDSSKTENVFQFTNKKDSERPVSKWFIRSLLILKISLVNTRRKSRI